LPQSRQWAPPFIAGKTPQAQNRLGGIGLLGIAGWLGWIFLRPGGESASEVLDAFRRFFRP
jgi:hypothetical protein